MTTDRVEELRRVVELLDDAYVSARDEMQRSHPDIEPLRMVDPNGRPILLDALTVLVSAQTALVNATTDR